MTQKFEFQASPTAAPQALAFLVLEGVQVDMEIGVDAKEQGRTQRITIDVTVGVPDEKTHILDSRDDLDAGGFDYGQIRTCIMDATSSKINLLETLANNIGRSVLRLPSAITCQVKVTKNRCWPNVEKTSVEIFRKNH